MKKIILTFICLLGYIAGHAMFTGQQIFKDNVQTLSVTNQRDFMLPPVIGLFSGDGININFDLISEQHEYLRYRLIHCNADWTPSRLLESEYIDGFNEVAIEDYEYSSNTYIHYINYNIRIPNPELPIIASGNYLLQVFPENDHDDIWLQARFSVSEEIAPGHGYYTPRTDKGVNSEYQQVFFDIESTSLGDINPFQDLVVSITQNNRPETTVLLNHPMRVDRNRIVFEHSPEMVFEAGNEYRRFETVRTDYPGMHVDSVKFKDGLWHAWLKPDVARKNSGYKYDRTQHGRFKIDEYNSSEPDLSADYVMVHFSLDPIERQYGAIYIDGDFTNHILSEKYRLKYDIGDGLYHVDIPLKQGSYNYQYLVLPDDARKTSVGDIEGNKYETVNEYLIKVFLRKPGARADRLVGTILL